MKVVTYIHTPFTDAISSSHEFMRSCEAFGYDVINVAKENHHVGNGEVLRLLYNTYKDLDEPVVYADGADSFFLRPINIPEDKILYSAERNVWPRVKSLATYWGNHYQDTELQNFRFDHLPGYEWKYLNGGGYCGPSKLIAEFFQRYGLTNHDAGANGQWQQAEAFFAAIKDGFPIELDTQCKEFQTIGFPTEKDFCINAGKVTNNLTGSTPALFHGNGRTNMQWVYNCLKETKLQTV